MARTIAALALLLASGCGSSDTSSSTAIGRESGYPAVDTTKRADLHVQGTVAGTAVDVRETPQGGMFVNGGSLDIPGTVFAVADAGVSPSVTAIHVKWNALVPDGGTAPITGTIHLPNTAASGEVTLCAGSGSVLYIEKTESAALSIFDLAFVSLTRAPDCTEPVAGDLRVSYSSNFDAR